MVKKFYYRTDTDNLVTSAHQDYQLKADFAWIKTSKFYNATAQFLSRWLYRGAVFYQKVKGIEVVNQAVLGTARHSGYLVYANHTQPFGDVMMPFALNGKVKRVYPIAHPANLGIPIIGRWLPLFGALPTPQTRLQYVRFLKAVKQRLSEKAVIMVYPEAHVWPYYTKIRPFPATSLRFAVDCQVPVFAATSTYQNRGKKKPKQVIYIDGPFYPDQTLPKKAAQTALYQEVFTAMTERSQKSNLTYYSYEKVSQIDSF